MENTLSDNKPEEAAAPVQPAETVPTTTAAPAAPAIPAAPAAPDAPARAHPLRGYLLAIIAGITWAGAGLISKWMGLDAMVLTGARTLASAVLIGLGLLIFNRSLFKVDHSPRSLGFLLLYGIVGMAGTQYFYFVSIEANGAGLGTLLKYLAPVFLLIVGALFYHRRITALAAVGAAVALIGQAFAVGAFSGSGLTLTRMGLIWGVACAVFFAIFTLLGDHGNGRVDSFSLLFYGMLIAAVFWLIIFGPARIITPFLHVKPLLQLLLLASLSTVVPFGAFLLSLRYIDPARASIAAMLEPVAAGIGGFFFFHEPLTFGLLFGGIISLGAIVIMRLSDIREARHPKEGVSL